MSHSRVETGDDMAVDEAGVALPTPEWMEAARKAADTDGILENASAKRQKVCISGYTLTSPGPCTCKPCTRMHTKERVSPENTSASRTIVQKMKEKEHQKGLLRLSSAAYGCGITRNPKTGVVITCNYRCNCNAGVITIQV